MAVEWTPAQRNAIDARDRTLLVSAAAGSGKTAVLTERIVERLRDPVSPASLDRMLVVTFTKAAAGELRARIAKNLDDALKEDPTNRHLAKQLASIASAKISTVDSFCYDIVKRNFDKLGLPCGMRIADGTEIALTKRKVMDAIFDDMYGGAIDFDRFDRFTDVFIRDRDDSLPELFLELYNRLSSYTDGIALLKTFSLQLRSDRDKPFLESAHGAFLLEYLTAFADTYETPAHTYAVRLANSDGKGAQYAAGFDTISTCMRDLRTALAARDFGAAKKAVCTYPQDNLKGARLRAEQDGECMKGLLDAFGEDIMTLKNKFFVHSEEQIRASYDDTIEVCERLYDFLSVFDEKFSAEKRRRRVLDYADIERYALALLCDGDAPSDYAREYGADLDEIYIDEYQDINELQDTVFRMISGTAHRFMVGDIKQSIYGFRGAEPSIFADYRARFDAYDAGTAQDAATVFLSENFRCAQPVVNFCNLIFPRLMCNAFGGVSYLPEDDLVYAKNDQTPTDAPVEVAVIDTAKNNRSPISEEEYVAARITELLREGYSPDDIVILLRSPKASAQAYEDALATAGVACCNADPAKFFDNPEVLLALCLLNVIDNPRRDVYLAGALKSPVFGFTLDELTLIRREREGGYLYDALCDYAEKNPSPKIDGFFAFLQEMREYAAGEPIDRLIRKLYSSTALLYNGSGEPDADDGRRANLMMLYEHARKFEAGSFKGLYNFILYINQVIAADQRIEEAKTSDASPAVRIMSVHASKGLQFKVCFLCAADYASKSEETRDTLLIDPNLGLGTYTPEKTGLAKVNGILRKIVAAKAETDRIAEEMRVLYVALTRAQERLIVTATARSASSLLARSELYGRTPSRYTMLKCNNFITMILAALQKNTTHPCWALNIVCAQNELDRPQTVQIEPTRAPVPDAPDYDTCMRTLTERFSFRYPHTDDANIPSKLSVSRLYPTVLDDQQTREADAHMNTLPRFLDANAAPTPAERGTATHVFMQFCDFDAVVRDGVDAEIERLISKKFIPEFYRDRIGRDALTAFFRSPLFEQMRSARRLWRETRFNITLPTVEFTQDEQTRRALSDQRILVQGVIDCFFEDANGVVTLVDYKTDTFSASQRAAPDACADILKRRHAAQLGYYRRAIEQLLGRAPEHTILYSFDLERQIEL